MRTSTIRKRLHQFIETADEKKMKDIYTLFENDIEQDDWEYTTEFKAELDSRYDQYKKDNKTVNASDANRQIKEVLITGKKK